MQCFIAKDQHVFHQQKWPVAVHSYPAWDHYTAQKPSFDTSMCRWLLCICPPITWVMDTAKDRFLNHSSFKWSFSLQRMCTWKGLGFGWFKQSHAVLPITLTHTHKTRHQTNQGMLKHPSLIAQTVRRSFPLQEERRLALAVVFRGVEM